MFEEDMIDQGDVIQVLDKNVKSMMLVHLRIMA